MLLTVLAAIAASAPPIQDAKPAERARANLSSYFSTDDYPPSAVDRGAEGVVRFALQIGAGGHVSKCTITVSSGDAALDAATCSILLGRARYAPARDAEGRPVAGRDSGSVTWRLPPPPAGRPFSRVMTVSRLSSSDEGGLDCVVTNNGAVETNVGPNYCGSLARSGALELLRQIPEPMEVTHVLVDGPEDEGIEAADANERSYGDLQFEVITEFGVDQSGRMVSCRVVSTNIPATSLLGEPAEPCELPPPGAPPLFEPTADPTPRRGRQRSALYIKGWPIDGPPPP